jgi:hypothetical protein
MEFHGTLFDIVLKSGQELNCFSKQDYRGILKTHHRNQNEFGIFVQENNQSSKATFIKVEDISYLRFPKSDVVSDI